MGEVYRAEDTKLKREVAIKVLPAAFSENEERLARFEREARLLASLNHPNIASIYGLEEAEGVKALVPARVAAAVIVGDSDASPSASPSSAFASPKSSTFTAPSSLILMFAGFRSRWMTPASWAASRASAICLAIAIASSSGIGPSAMRSASVGPWTSSRIPWTLCLGPARISLLACTYSRRPDDAPRTWNPPRPLRDRLADRRRRHGRGVQSPGTLVSTARLPSRSFPLTSPITPSSKNDSSARRGRSPA